MTDRCIENRHPAELIPKTKLGFGLCETRDGDSVLRRSFRQSGLRHFCDHLFERPREIDQCPKSQEIDADKRLDPRDHADPTFGAKRVLAGLHSGDPAPDVEVAPADVKG